MTVKPWLKNRRGTVYKVTFPTVPSLNARPSELELHQEIYAHDILEIKFPRSSEAWEALLKTGTPVTLDWGDSQSKRTWTGYVTHVSNQSAAQGKRELKVVCTGASYLLKERANKVWKNKTPVEVAKAIASQFKFKFVAEPTTRKFDQLAMTGQSYWEFLQELAKKIGFILTVENTTIYMQSIKKTLDAATSDAAILAIEYPFFPQDAKAFDRTLDSFTVLKGDYFDTDDNPYATKVAAGINPLTSKPITSSAKPFSTSSSSTRKGTKQTLFTDYSKDVVHTASFAKNTVKDIALGSRFAFPARAKGQGDPRMSPYSAVFIGGTSDDTDGFWMIKKITHSFRLNGAYEAELDVLTDGIGATTKSPFRKANPSLQGTIDLNALVVSSSSEVSLSKKTSRLVSQTLPVKQNALGFAEAPTYWRNK